MNRNAWLLGVTLTAALLPGGLVRAQEKDRTQEDPDSKGLTKEEEAYLYGGASGASAQFVRKFKAGRASFSKDQKSRNARVFEMHDANFDGVTDHSTSQGPSTLEGNTERAAFGKDRMSDEARKKATEEFQKKKFEACQKKYQPMIDAANAAAANAPPGTPPKPAPDLNAICYQPSQNIENVGSAHGGELGEHRIYKVTDKAKQEAENAGKAYADDAMSEMAYYDYATNPDIRKSATKGKIMVRALKDGKESWEERDIAPNIDLLQSEAAWLEEQKEMNVLSGFKQFRAKNLGGSELSNDKGLENIVASAYKSQSPEDVKKGDAIVAKEVAARTALSSNVYCADGKKAEADASGATCGVPAGSPTPAKTMNFKDFSATLAPGQREQFTQQELGKLSPQQKQQAQKNLANIQRCMGAGEWCDKNDRDQQGNPTYKKVTGDPGAHFKDTREYIYEQTYAGMKGSLDSYEARMAGNADFKNSPDFKDFQKQVRDNQKSAQEFQQQERDREAYARSNGGSYQSQYLGGQFDTKRMNSRQLFGRDQARGDAAFLGSTARGTFVPTRVRTQTGDSGGQIAPPPPQPGRPTPGAPMGTPVRLPNRGLATPTRN